MKKKTVAKKTVSKKTMAKKKISLIKDSGGWPWPNPIRTFEPGYGTHSAPEEKTEWVLVDTISTFRNRYLVEVPVGKKEWALDSVTMQEAKEFSQKYLDETIASERVISEVDALKLFDEDNDYLSSWDSAKKKEIGFTSMHYLEKLEAEKATK